MGRMTWWLLLALMLVSGCISMQTRRGIAEQAVNDHPELQDLRTLLHQNDGQFETILARLDRIEEALRACKPVTTGVEQ